MKTLARSIFSRIIGTLFLLALIAVQGCEELNVLPNDGPYDPETGMSTVEYFRSLEWDGRKEYVLLADLIEHSGVSLSGNTLFAPADNNWQSWMNSNGWATVNDVPVQTLADVLMNHMVAGRKKRLDLDLPDVNPQTLEGVDIDSEVTNMAGNTLYVNVNFFGNTGRGYYYRVGTTSANKLIMVGDVENTDAVVNLMGFLNDGNQGKGLLLP